MLPTKMSKQAKQSLKGFFTAVLAFARKAKKRLGRKPKPRGLTFYAANMLELNISFPGQFEDKLADS